MSRGPTSRVLASWGVASCLAALGCAGKDQTLVGTGLPSALDPGVTPPEATVALDTPIVFRSDRAAADVGDLFAMAADGSGAVPLTNGGDYYFPRWSPDGQSLAFRSDGDTGTDLGVLALDGSLPVILTQGESGFVSVPPSWSLDGQNIAFGSARDDELHVWVVPRSGGTAQRLFPKLNGGEDTATWAWAKPSRLAFTGPMNASEDLWLVDDPSSSDLVNLTNGQVFAPSYPRWSPDATRVAFSGYARLADGSVEGLSDQTEPGFSAPGTEIFVVDVNTKELLRVTNNAWEDQTPAWSPDGKSLLFASNRDGDFDIWRVSLDDLEHPIDLIDDADDPHADDTPDWYRAPSQQ